MINCFNFPLQIEPSIDDEVPLVVHCLIDKTSSQAQPTNKKIIINISGQQFVTRFNTLLKYPQTRLGKLAAEQPDVSHHFFESDVEIFKEVLKFYKLSRVHCPKNTCLSDFQEHLRFWEIDERYIAECCSRELKDHQELEKQFEYFNRTFKLADKDSSCYRTYRYAIWSFLTDPYGADTRWKRASKVWMVFYLLVTFFSGMVLALETLPHSVFGNQSMTINGTEVYIDRDKFIGAQVDSCEKLRVKVRTKHYETLQLINFSLVVFYTIEIWVRFSVCPDKRRFFRSINALDLLISVGECVCYGFGIYVGDIIRRYRGNVSDQYCIAAEYTDNFIIVLGQLRFFRLLSYASVYR